MPRSGAETQISRVVSLHRGGEAGFVTTQQKSECWFSTTQPPVLELGALSWPGSGDVLASISLYWEVGPQFFL